MALLRRHLLRTLVFANAMLFFIAYVEAQVVPNDLWSEKPAHCHAWIQNRGQLLGTDGQLASRKITHFQRGVFTDIYLNEQGVASFAWSSNDLDSTTADTTFRIDLFPAGNRARVPRTHEFEQFSGHSNYYSGSLPTPVEGVKGIGHVVWHNAFKNIDLTWSSNKVGTKLYVTLYPDSDPDSVIFRFQGSDSLKVDWQGILKAYLSGKWIELKEAVAYQLVDNSVVPVPWTADWQLLNELNTVKLAFGTYDPSYPLVLMFGIPEAMGGGGSTPDPENLTWSTYVGGNMPDEFAAIDLDAEGNPYVCGYTYSNNFPVGVGFSEFSPWQSVFLGSEDMVTMKFNKYTKRLLWSTYHGGSGMGDFPSNFHAGQDKAQDITVYKGPNADLNFAFITGVTYSGDFFIGNYMNTPHPFGNAYVRPNSPRNQRAIVAAYRQSNGSLCWATTHGSNFIGHSEQGICIDVDEDGTLALGGHLIAGSDPILPSYPYVTPPGAYTKGNGGGFFVLFNNSYQIEWCTPFGSYSQNEWLHDLMIARRSRAPYNKVLYLTGWAVSPIPGGGPWGSLDVMPSTLPDAYYQASSAGGSDAYFARLDIDGTHQLEYSTYWGGAGQDRGMSLAKSPRLDGGLDIFMAGGTFSSDLGSYPNMARLPDPGNGVPFRSTLLGNSDGFLLRFDDSTDRLTWGTLIGGEAGDAVVDVALAPGDQLLLTGHTRSANDVVMAPNAGLYSQTLLGNDPSTQHHDAFLILLNKHRNPLWTSYLGGTKTDRTWAIVASEDELYLAGGTNSDQFTFPLKEFDPFSNLDYFDGNHLNNGTGTHGGLSWGPFNWGFYTGPSDPVSTQPDGFICSFAISPNVSVHERSMLDAVPMPAFVEQGVWLLPWDEGDSGRPTIQVYDATGRIVATNTRRIDQGIMVDLSRKAHGIFVVRLVSRTGKSTVYKLSNP